VDAKENEKKTKMQKKTLNTKTSERRCLMRGVGSLANQNIERRRNAGASLVKEEKKRRREDYPSEIVEWGLI